MRGKAKSILHHKVSPVSGCERSNGLGQPCFEAPIPCHTWPHALKLFLIVMDGNTYVYPSLHLSVSMAARG